MKPNEIMTLMIQRAGKSALSVGRELGHSQSWAYMTTRSGRDPKLSTVAAIADVTGHEIAILDRSTGEVVATVTPPRAEGDAQGEGD